LRVFNEDFLGRGNVRGVFPEMRYLHRGRTGLTHQF